MECSRHNSCLNSCCDRNHRSPEARDLARSDSVVLHCCLCGCESNQTSSPTIAMRIPTCVLNSPCDSSTSTMGLTVMRLLDRERLWLDSLRPLERCNATAAYLAVAVWLFAVISSALLHWYGDAYLAYNEYEEIYVNVRGYTDVLVVTAVLVAVVIVTFTFAYYDTLDVVADWEAEKAKDSAKQSGYDPDTVKKNREWREEQILHLAPLYKREFNTLIGTTIWRLCTLGLPLFGTIFRFRSEDSEAMFDVVAMTPEALAGYLLLFIIYYERIHIYARLGLVIVLVSFYASYVL